MLARTEQNMWYEIKKNYSGRIINFIKSPMERSTSFLYFFSINGKRVLVCAFADRKWLVRVNNKDKQFFVCSTYFSSFMSVLAHLSLSNCIDFAIILCVLQLAYKSERSQRKLVFYSGFSSSCCITDRRKSFVNDYFNIE